MQPTNKPPHGRPGLTALQSPSCYQQSHKDHVSSSQLLPVTCQPSDLQATGTNVTCPRI